METTRLIQVYFWRRVRKGCEVCNRCTRPQVLVYLHLFNQPSSTVHLLQDVTGSSLIENGTKRTHDRWKCIFIPNAETLFLTLEIIWISNKLLSRFISVLFYSSTVIKTKLPEIKKLLKILCTVTTVHHHWIAHIHILLILDICSLLKIKKCFNLSFIISKGVKKLKGLLLLFQLSTYGHNLNNYSHLLKQYTEILAQKNKTVVSHCERHLSWAFELNQLRSPRQR